MTQGIPSGLDAQLNSARSAERNAAVRDLGRIALKLDDAALRAQALELLIRALEDERATVRKSAAAALGGLGGERAVEALIRALRDSRAEVRFSAAAALGRVGDTRAVEPLLPALEDPSKYVRLEAAFALRKLGQAVTKTALRERVRLALQARLDDTASDRDHPHITVAAVARQALSEIDTRPALAEPAPLARPTTVFISYAHSDGRDLAGRLEADLRARGFPIWWDQGLQGGQDWENEIRDAIDRSDALVVIFTRSAVRSRYVRAEWHYALDERNIPVIPLLAPGFDPADLPLVLRIIQWVDARSDYSAALGDLVRALQEDSR